MKTHHHHKHWEVGMSLSGSPTDMNEVGRGYLTRDIFRIQSFPKILVFWLFQACSQIYLLKFKSLCQLFEPDVLFRVVFGSHSCCCCCYFDAFADVNQFQLASLWNHLAYDSKYLDFNSFYGEKNQLY